VVSTWEVGRRVPGNSVLVCNSSLSEKATKDETKHQGISTLEGKKEECGGGGGGRGSTDWKGRQDGEMRNRTES
jgi:hypothetical protein